MKIVSNYDPLRRNIATAFLRAVDECVGNAKENAPVSVSRGAKLNAGETQGGLRASISATITGTLQARFGSALRYAMQREKGGTIVPVRKKLLSWIDPITGKRIFAKRVTQRPGGPRQPHPYSAFIGPAGDRFPEFMDDHLRALG
jgi:hypothetical protein